WRRHLHSFTTRRSSDLHNPSDAGFGTLAEFEGHALHLVPGALIAALSRIEIARLGAGTEVPGSDLPDQIAAMLEMIGRDPALAGVMGEPAEAGPSVQCPHGVRRQGAGAHGRDVEQGHAVGLLTVRPTHFDARRAVRFGHRGGGMDEVFVADGVDIAFGAECLLAVDSLRTLVHDGADIAVERS